jgi:hypothetical protein
VIFFAYLLFLLSAFKCFLTVAKTNDYKIFLGYWSRESVEISSTAGSEDNNYCIGWDQTTEDNEFDAAWKFGKTVGAVGTIVSTILVIVSFYILFYKIATRFFSYMLYANVCMAILSLFLLTGLGSDVCKIDDCKIGPGGWLAIFDFFWWVGSAYATLKLRTLSEDPDYTTNPSLSREQPAQPGMHPDVEKEVEKVDNDDRSVTRVTTITTTKPSGKKKVDKVKRIMDKEPV